MKTSVTVNGRELDCITRSDDGEVVSHVSYPANLTYKAAALDACANERERAAVVAAVHQDDPLDEEPAPKPAKKSAAVPAKKKKK